LVNFYCNFLVTLLKYGEIIMVNPNAIISTMQEDTPATISPALRLLVQAFFIFFSGLFLFLVLALSIVLLDQILHAGRVMPGVTMNGIDLSGLEPGQAALAILNETEIGADHGITLQCGDTIWQALPSQLGIELDAPASAQEAYLYGRQGSLGSILAYQLFGRRSNHDLQPIITFDEQAAFNYLSQIAREFNQPVKEAELGLSGTQVVALPGQVGLALDIEASLEVIAGHLRRLDTTPILLPIQQEMPGLLDASPFMADAQSFLSRPFELTISAGQPDASQSITLPVEQIAPMLTFSRQQDSGKMIIKPRFRDDLLRAYLADMARRVAQQPRNARFIFNDDTLQLDLLASAVTGRELDIEESLAAIQSAVDEQRSSAALAFKNLSPQVSDTASAENLGIKELVHEESSYFFGSSDARIQNIEKAASEFHGLLVPPGATFSMAANMGDISLDNGYSEALIIFNGRTIEGIGGGVCQVSTTLFRAAFFAGFPIEERHPHAYRVSYYEKTASNGRNSNLAGLDATVFIPLVDFKFTNDTPYWLLMETYISRAANRITWKFYSTSDGRSVEWETSGPVSIVEPKKPLYKKNPDLETGEIKQVDWEADGADVRVDRYVFRDGQLINSDVFRTHYEPWRAIYEYGPGTEGIPEDGSE
jgi:vancomycin resistance protein YoaR